jgi:trans-aconitate methyltransferase
VGADEGYFGERVAAVYDAHSAGMFDPAGVGPAVELVAELAGDGTALEFAIGTGRIALPLAERGVRVVGIDNSEAMLARLREKPGAERIEAMVGDMAATRVDGEFSLVYLVFNTIFNLVTQDGQVACFENAAAHLRSGGAVRDRGARAGASAVAARSNGPAVAGRPRWDVLLRL